MNKVIIGVVASLTTLFIAWLSYTVYDTSVKVAVIEKSIEQIYPALQYLSEKKQK